MTHETSERPPSLFSDHRRSYRENRFVYPVLSRRSQGLSIGINLNPDRICNFDCIYCQVDRRSTAETRFVEIDQLIDELDAMLQLVTGGAIYDDEPFSGVAGQLRRLNDIAFSGDGEPTTYRNFDEIVQRVAAIKTRHTLEDVKMVLITNASMFHRPAVQRGLELLDSNNGEVWAKLDAGTEDYYQLIERTKIPFRQVLDNITAAAQLRPLVIQSLFMQVHNEPPSSNEIDEFCNRLSDICNCGGRIKLVQVYTVARPPAESYVAPLSDAQVDAIAERVRTQSGLPADVYYGA
jgi:wyosine [tRNA(Phe)-imidazoG37] synthetase (radical SAM superfamily)